MNKPNNKRKKESQDRMEKAFLQFVQKKEINEISVTDICKSANVNRSTFYANYLDIYDLADKVRERMIFEYASMYDGNTDGHTKENYIKMFKNIKENQIFYRTYFKLNYDSYSIPDEFLDKDLSKKYYNNKLVDYHAEFFKAGISAIIKKWLNNNCKESPEDIASVIFTEYEGKA